MRDYLFFYINGQRHRVDARKASMNLSEYLRESLNLTGTKVVCSEGDCGACTVLVHRYSRNEKETFSAVNSCILPLYQLDCCHIITVEGVEETSELHPVQKAIAEFHGTQCGFCTPGIVNSLLSMADDMICNGGVIDEQKAKNYTTGNLCRCTGYKGIVDAALSLKLTEINPIYTRYHNQKITEDFERMFQERVELVDTRGDVMIALPKTVEEVAALKADGAIISSGGTDVGVLVNKGYSKPTKVVVMSNVTSSYELQEDGKALHIGASVSLSEVEQKTKESFAEFSEFLHIFASPQIKNSGTLIGNIANGSPIGDTLPFLVVSGATLELIGVNKRREVSISEFYLGYKQFDMATDEVINRVTLPKCGKKFKLYKVSARKDLDISAVSLAVSYGIEEGKPVNIAMAYGGVAATVYQAKAIDAIFKEKGLNKTSLQEAVALIPDIISPLSDHRASKTYRIKLCQNLLQQFFDETMMQGEVN